MNNTATKLQLLTKTLLSFFLLVHSVSSLSAETIEIRTKKDLFDFAKRVNDGDEYLNAVLLNDIDLDGQKWEPVGKIENTSPNVGVSYKGEFNGKGHKVCNFSVYEDCGANDNYLQGSGFFGCIDGGTVDSLVVSCDNMQATTGSVGFVCGYLKKGRILNCTAYGIMDQRWRANAGGICGYAVDSKISYSSNYSDIKSEKSKVGGICGRIKNSNITSCLNVGIVEGVSIYGGGIVGESMSGSSISNNLNLGKVTSDNEGGGICALGTPIGSNNYCLSGIVNSFYEISDSSITKYVTESDLKNGSVAYLLCKADTVWGQLLGKDNTPMLHAPCVYKANVYNADGTENSLLWNKGYMFTPDGNQLLFADEEGIIGDNVVVNGSCAKMKLQDNEAFYTPSSFKINSVSYDRGFANNAVYSFCLPFAVNADEVSGTIYKLEKMNDEGFYFESVKDRTEANKPYIIKAIGGNLLLPNGAKNTECVAGGCSSFNAVPVSHIGTYSQQVFQTNEDSTYFAIKGGRMTRANNGVIITTYPFRTVFGMKNKSASPKPSYGLMFDGELGAAPNIDNEDEVLYGNVYDMQGRLMLSNVDLQTALNAGLPNGVFVLNRTKIIVRNGKAEGKENVLKKNGTKIVAE